MGVDVSTEFDPNAFRAAVEQMEATMRDTFVESTLRMHKTARDLGASDDMAVEISGQWMGYLLSWLPTRTPQ